MVKEAHKPTRNAPLEKFGLPLLWCRWFNIGTHCSHFVTPCSPLFHRCFTLLSASTHCSCLCCTMQALVMEKNRLKTKDWKSWTWSLDCFPIHRSSPSPITWIRCGDFEQMLGSSKNHTTILCFLTGRRIWSLSHSTWLVKRSPALWPRLGFIQPSQRGRWSLHWSSWPAANIEVTYLHVPSSLAASQSAWPPFCGLERSGVRWSGSRAYM